MLTQVKFNLQQTLRVNIHLSWHVGQYDEAKEKKIQMDDFRVEVYKSLEITDLLELQGGPRNH